VLLAAHDRFEQYASATTATVAYCSPWPTRARFGGGRTALVAISAGCRDEQHVTATAATVEYC
jgi:hypothetical protein